jgi:hypothetical protein
MELPNFVYKVQELHERPNEKICFELSWRPELPSLEFLKVQKFPQIRFFNAILDSYLTFFPSFLSFVKFYQNIESIYRGILFTFSFSHFILKLCILFFLSFNYLLQVPPSLEGAELIKQRMLEDNFEEVFSLFTTFHDIDVL